MPQTGERVDPFRVFNFLVELDGIAQASFIECSGLGTTTEVIETIPLFASSQARPPIPTSCSSGA